MPTERGWVVIAVACSAGGLNALSHFLSALPEGLSAPVLVVQHMQPGRKSFLANILSRRTRLLVSEARDGESLEPGHVYLAPPDRHLTIGEDRTVKLLDVPPVRFLRPSADLLFKSAAENYGKGVIGVVLSGTGYDGASGVLAIKQAEGTVIIQDEATSEFFGMPGAAMRSVEADLVAPLDDIADAVVQLLAQRREQPIG